MEGSEAKVILARREKIMYAEYIIVRVFMTGAPGGGFIPYLLETSG